MASRVTYFDIYNKSYAQNVETCLAYDGKTLLLFLNLLNPCIQESPMHVSPLHPMSFLENLSQSI